MKKISIIIPCYNSFHALETNLPYLIHFCSEKKYDVEFLIVDDGSQFPSQVSELANQFKCQFLHYPENKGKGFAVRYGVKHSKGDIIIFTDSDIPFEGEAIVTSLYYLDFKEYDLVVGDRGLKESNYFEKVTSKRRFGSGFFTFIVGRFVTTGFSDTQCGFKAFKREIALDLFSKSTINGFAFDVELIYISLKRNYDIKKIPVILRSQDGNSVSVLKHGLIMLVDLFKIKLNHLKGLYNR
jgi:dolichyl-phosphate beta-glucosyltransferase